MALVDNFDSYTDGDLNGQGSWSGNAAFDVQGTVVQAGAKAISCATGGDITVSKSFTATASDSQVFYMRTNTTSRTSATDFYTGVTLVASLVFSPTLADDIRLNTTAASTILASLLADTWYKVEVQWDAALGTNGQLRARVDDGTWSAYQEATADFTTIDTLKMLSDMSATTCYWDSFSSGLSSDHNLTLLGVGT